MEPLELIEWLGALPLGWGLVILAISAAIEYVFPPFPGDTVTLAGAIMVGAAGWPWWAVVGVIVLGSSAGIIADWYAGHWLEHSPRRTWMHRALERPASARAVARVKARFEKHGSWFILVNRFVPAFRSVFFLVSGMVGVPLSRVLSLGVLSVLLWTAALLGVGMSIGFHIETLVSWMSRYSMVAWTFIALVAVWWCWNNLVKKWIAKRSKKC